MENEEPPETKVEDAIDWEALSPLAGELTELLDGCHGLMTATERRFVEGAREFDRAKAYLVDGARTMVDWLCWRYEMSRSKALCYVTVARRLSDLPELEAVYEKGLVSIDQLRPIVEVADEETDSSLAEQLPGLSEPQCRQLARRLRAVQIEERNEVHRRRFLRWFERDDAFVLKGELSVEDGAVVETLIRHLADGAPKNEETGHYEPFATRAADALVEACSLVLSEVQSRDADVATVVCHVDPLTLAGFEGEAELAGGQQLATETVRRLLCDCRFQMLKENDMGEPVGIGRTSRVIPPWMRRSLHKRDGGCRFPGCPRRIWVDRHHIEHWADGGPTDPDNILELCRGHHRVVHEQGWKVIGDPAGEVTFASPTGRMVTSRPDPPSRSILERFGLWKDPPPPDP